MHVVLCSENLKAAIKFLKFRYEILTASISRQQGIYHDVWLKLFRNCDRDRLVKFSLTHGV